MSPSPSPTPVADGGETIVVVGAGQAGGWAALTLRDEGFAGRVVLVGDEMHPPHERPPLSKAVLSGQAPAVSVHLFPPDLLRERAIEWHAGRRVRALDCRARHAVMEDGSVLPYDRLVLCTGGRARTLAVPGADLPGVFTLRSIDDSLSLAGALGTAKRLVIVGGGWIGLEVAATARAKGIDVTIVEAAPALCARSVPPSLSAFLLDLHARNGVRVLMGGTVSEVSRAPGGALSVSLADGHALDADAVVIAVGLAPNDGLAREAGIACDGGVLVDAACRTSDPRVFAAGDVAALLHRASGRRLRLESWRNAQDQGMAAARAALGKSVDYDPLPWFWTDQYDVNLQIYGLPAPTQRLVVRGDVTEKGFLGFLLEDDRVKAVFGVNAARQLRLARKLIEDATRVRDADLGDPAIALTDLAAMPI